jgi:D-amino-acid dehydrogenase
VGFTLGGVTGKVVAELAAGRALSVDLSPFRADRFKTKAWWRPFA